MPSLMLLNSMMASYDQPILELVTTWAHGAATTYANLSDPQKKLMDIAACDINLATMFIAQSDKCHTGKLIKELKNDYTRGQDGYPTDMVQAFKVLNEFQHWQPQSSTPEATGTAFVQSSCQSGSSHDDWTKKATCHNCGKVGHIKPQCPLVSSGGQ